MLTMNRIIRTAFSLFIFSISSLSLSAQYGPQFENRGFEEWTSREENASSEPIHWHSGGTATGSLAGFLSSQIEPSSQVRPGSTGTKSVKVFPKSTLFVTANGTITSGRMNAGSTSASGAENYNYTQRAESSYNTVINQQPDSLTVWVCFRSQSGTDRAQVKSVIHGDVDFKLCADGSEIPSNMLVASAVSHFTRTSTANGAFTWRRLSIPFQNGPCTDVRYVLFTSTTNVTPGSGSTNDDLYLDDVLLVYKPTLRMEQLEASQLIANTTVTIPFSLTGTMSPENLNAEPNIVIAQLSDANGDFGNPTELGRLTTNQSGSIMAQIPNVSGQHYRIRVVSTNYPMIGENIQEFEIVPNTNVEENLASCKIYPNPLSSFLKVESEQTVNIIRIYDLSGRLVKEKTVAERQFNLNLSDLKNGAYLLQLDYGDSTSCHRITIVGE